jgi:predicted Zn-dependent peptidase
MYEKVTPQDIMNVAKKYYVTTGLTIATISDAENCPVK